MEHWEQEREKIIGLGHQSIRKSYYPILKARLRELERFRQMLDHSIDGIVVLSLTSGKILDANRAAAKLLGTPTNQIVGADYRKLFQKHSDQKIRNFLNNDDESTLSGHRVEMEQSGESVILELNLSREVIDSETIIVAIFRDITPRVEAEKKLKKARDEAQKANQAKSDFLAVVSHEMRTPLNPILGFSQILREVLDGTPEAEYLDHIVDAANRQLALVDDILTYTAMDRGTVTGNWTVFDLYETCLSALSVVKIQANQLNFSFEFGSESAPIPQDLHVSGEQSMLLRILDNLLSNACKYTHQGVVTLKVWEQKIDNLSSRFYFAVSDTGIGMSQETQKTIFEAFTQADSSHKRSYEGIGLGLAICRKLVSYLRGEITCSSQPKLGSTFTFWIPMRTISQAPDPVRTRKYSENPEFRQQNLKVLIVEDREDNARLPQVVLEKNGAQIEVAENGEIATRKCMLKRFDCILMDLSMPVMSGFEAACMIREHGLNCETPIIAITADVTPRIKERCKAVGIDAYLSKPITPTNLLKLVREITENTAKQS